MRLGWIACAVCVLTQPFALSAENTTYSYDALGQLLATDSRRGSGSGSGTTYVYDLASNRRLVTASGSYRATFLPSGATLYPGQAVLSADNRYKLVFQADSNLVLYSQSGSPLWWSGTYNGGGVSVAMQTDGNLVMYTAAGAAIWSTNTQGHQGSRLAVQVDGNLVVYTAAGTPIWAIYGL